MSRVWHIDRYRALPDNGNGRGSVQSGFPVVAGGDGYARVDLIGHVAKPRDQPAKPDHRLSNVQNARAQPAHRFIGRPLFLAYVDGLADVLPDDCFVHGGRRPEPKRFVPAPWPGARDVEVAVLRVRIAGEIAVTEEAGILVQYGRTPVGEEPTPDELARRMEMPEDKVRKVLKIAKEPISMETPVGDDDDSHLGDFLKDAGAASPIDSATDSGLKETTHAVLAGLTPREAKVLRMRFGIDMNTDHTLEEVGKQFDVTRERIRQIEAKALRKLRHPSRSDQLRGFLLEE